MKKYKTLLNFIILGIVLLNLGVVLVNIVMPVKYDIHTTGKNLKNYDDVSAIYGALTQYLNVYQTDNVEAFNSMIPEKNRKTVDQYHKIGEFVNQKYHKTEGDTLYITKVEHLKNTTYVVEYALSSPQKGEEDIIQKCVIKLNKAKSQFYIYYDSLWEKG